MSQKPIRVLLVDDHPLFRAGIKACLDAHLDISVVGEASDGLEAIQNAKALNPTVILLDIGLPKMNGLEAAKRLRQEQPQCEILVLSAHNRSEYLVRFLELGAKGYIIKDSPADQLLIAVRAVSKGQKYIDPRVMATTTTYGSEINTSFETLGALESLSSREREVLRLIGTCSRNKEIAEKLGISVRTVEGHRRLIMQKLAVTDVATLVRYSLSLESLLKDAPNFDNKGGK